MDRNSEDVARDLISERLRPIGVLLVKASGGLHLYSWVLTSLCLVESRWPCSLHPHNILDLKDKLIQKGQHSPHTHDVAAALLVSSVVPPLDSHPAAGGLGVRLLLAPCCESPSGDTDQHRKRRVWLRGISYDWLQLLRCIYPIHPHTPHEK